MTSGCVNVALLTLLALVTACHGEPAPRHVTVFAAASMGQVLDQLREPFKAICVDCDLRVEISGSRVGVAKIADQHLPADLVITADADLIDDVLRPEHTAFNAAFAVNALVLAVSPDSSVHAELARGSKWQQVLLEPEVRIGHADPAQAPVGYRTLMALDLNDRVASDNLKTGAQIAARLDRKYMRDDVSKLTVALATNAVDVAFIYLSEAEQQSLQFVRLDPRIDFSDHTKNDVYATARYTTPALASYPARNIRGTAALYGLTVPKNAEHPDMGYALARLLLSPKGREVAAKAHVTILSHPRVSGASALPLE
ncbi:MAG: substrate-binding domain-containing protein [Clostridia bacterium]|nr:substrate-binding domain-containing protein [Deltaproteobacteria bacterium]